LPAIVFLHGKGECGTDGQKQAAVGIGPAILLEPYEWNCIVIMPQKPDPAKEWDDYDQMVMDQLAAAQREWNIDPARITLAGLSQGGHGTWVIGSHHTDVFAAIAPICGHGEPAGIADALAAAGTPVWAFHGLNDDVVSPDETRRMVEAIQEARASAGARGPEPRLSLFPDANHNSWDQAYRQEGLAAWLLGQKRK
jgi:predicted peptidase